MTDDLAPIPSEPPPPDIADERSRGLPLVWLIPIVAALIGAWLAYTTFSEKGPTITITFDVATGIEPGKTQIKYRDVELGLVEDVALSPDLTHVVVTAQMHREAGDHLHEGTSFWVESPQLTASGVSGLTTLVSGVYIGMLPGKAGKPLRTFVGLKQPPVLQVDVAGRRYDLHAEKLGSVAVGSPVYFRGIRVGEVLTYSLDPSGKGVTIVVFVRAPHDALVREQTHFWNASGIDLSVGAGGVTLRTESVVSVLIGGIAFDTPVEASAGPPSPEGTGFVLFPSYSAIGEAQFTEKVPYLVYFTGSVSGLQEGAPVLFRGIRIGTVTDIRLEFDEATHSVRIPVRVEIEPQRAFFSEALKSEAPYSRVKTFVERGLRAQLASGNLLTGALVIAVDFFPDEPPASVTFQDGVAVIPTIPSQVEQLAEKARAFIEKMSKAPIAELITDLRTAVRDADALISSPALKRGIDGTDQIGPLLDSLRATSDSARATLAQADQAVGPESSLRYDLARLITELTDTARSLRTLADVLERNPNALIFGKPISGDQ